MEDFKKFQENKLKEQTDKLQISLNKMSDNEKDLIESIIESLKIFKPDFYQEEAYMYQCVYPLINGLLEIGQNIEKREKN